MDSQTPDIFRRCSEAIDAGVLIKRENSMEKKFHFKNWLMNHSPRRI